MIVEAVNRVNRALVLASRIRTMRPPSVAARTVAQDGPPVGLGTAARNWWPGSRRSRAMEKISRPLVTMMTRPQAKIDTTTKTRKNFCTTLPSTAPTMYATGAVLE